MPKASTIAHRLYLTAFRGLLSLGILVPLVSLVIQVHDWQGATSAARCLKDKLDRNEHAAFDPDKYLAKKLGFVPSSKVVRMGSGS